MGTKIKTAPFLDYYLERKKNITLWNKSLKVNTPGVSNSAVDEPVVVIKDPAFSKKKENIKQEPETASLVPIGEEEEDDNEQSLPPRSNKQEAYEEDDDEVNASLNDRAQEFNPEVAHEQELEQMNNPVIEDEKIPELVEDTQAAYEEEKVGGNEDIVEDNPNGPKFNKGPVVMRLAVYNFNKHKVKLEIEMMNLSFEPNMYVPSNKLKTDVYSSKNKAICYFHKIHPEKPFGEVKFEYEEIDKKELEEKPASGDQQTGTAVGTGTTGGSSSAKEDNEFDGYQDEISCGTCTLLNPLSAHKCSVCGATLPHRA